MQRANGSPAGKGPFAFVHEVWITMGSPAPAHAGTRVPAAE